MFLTTDIMIVTKTDLLPYVPFSLDAVFKDAKEVNNGIDIFLLSSLKGEGMDEWCNWLLEKVKDKKEVNVVTNS